MSDCKNKEELWQIKAKDSKSIYGIRNFKANNKNAVICIHGLTRDMHDHIFKRLSEVFPARGIDVIRYNLYGAESDARKLSQAGLAQYSSDFRRVFNAYAQEYKAVFVIGHSFGGVIALSTAVREVQAYSLWDPSYNTVDWPRFAKRYGNIMTMEVFGREYVYASKLVNDFSKLNDQFCKSLSQKIHVPLQVIFAGDGDLIKNDISYHTHARQAQKDVILGATHLFSERHSANSLCTLTESWFKRSLNNTLNMSP